MQIALQNSPEREQLGKLVEDMTVAMLTSLDADGAMVSRPMAPLEMDSDGALWFFTDKRSAKVEHLRVVNLSFSDEAHATYVSLTGRGKLVTDRTLINRLWTEKAKPWFPDGPDSPNLALLKFEPESAEYWDAPSSKMVRMFAMAASVVTGKQIELGEHETLSGLSARPAKSKAA